MKKTVLIVLTLIALVAVTLSSIVQASFIGETSVEHAAVISSRVCLLISSGWSPKEVCSENLSFTNVRNKNEFETVVQFLNERAQNKKQVLLNSGDMVRPGFKFELLRSLLMMSPDVRCVLEQGRIVRCD